MYLGRVWNTLLGQTVEVVGLALHWAKTTVLPCYDRVSSSSDRPQYKNSDVAHRPTAHTETVRGPL